MSSKYFQFISFVKPNDNLCETKSQDLNGNEIKEFYENLILSEDPINQRIKSEVNQNVNKVLRKKTEIIKTNSDLCPNQKLIKLESIFKICQNGDLEECRQWIQMGFDINTKDQYLWTPLMCSSCAGHESIVKILLENNADKEVKDKTGRTAFDLALINGHQNVCHLISGHKKSKINDQKTNKKTKSIKRNKVIENNRKKCDICGHEYNESDVHHNCSIVHRIHLKDNRKFNKYFEISERNKGFQMLLRNGWTRDRGLGPQGLGMTAPLKTILKRDRLGLGNPHNKPKVTHFNSFDETSVKQNKTSKEFQRNQKKRHLKRIEIMFRRDFK